MILGARSVVFKVVANGDIEALHECCDPELTIDHKADIGSTFAKPLYNSRHQVAYDDQIADSDPKAFDSYCCIEYDCGIGISDLRKGEKGGGSSLQISGASCLKIKTKTSGDASPQDDEDSQCYSHARKGQGHS